MFQGKNSVLSKPTIARSGKDRCKCIYKTLLKQTCGRNMSNEYNSNETGFFFLLNIHVNKGLLLETLFTRD